MTLEYVKHEKISLKKHPVFNEVWLQEQIANDPSILGLGEIDLLSKEKKQESGGRLDLLLSDAENNRRYEVEIMLGSTDPSHIIRCIEYWDIERRRYPAYDHIAVLVAEEITTRFLNVISLMSGTIPIIAIQLDALKIGNNLVLNFVQVLKQTVLREDDTIIVDGDVDRSYWDNLIPSSILSLCDRLLDIINEKAEIPQTLNYKKRYIGLKAGGTVRNFVTFVPKKSFLRFRVNISDADEWLKRLEDKGIPAELKKAGALRVVIQPDDYDQHKETLREVIHQAVDEYQQ